MLRELEWKHTKMKRIWMICVTNIQMNSNLWKQMCRVQTLLRFRCYRVHNKVLQMSMALWEQTQSSMEAWKFEIITSINREVRRQGGPRAVSSGAVQGIGRVENSMKEAQQQCIFYKSAAKNIRMNKGRIYRMEPWKKKIYKEETSVI